MRIVELNYQNDIVTISADGKLSTIDEMHPMDILATAIAKDTFEDIKNVSSQLEFELGNFSVRIKLRKNTEKAKSKIIETQIILPAGLSDETKNKLQKIADRSHLKRLLGNEIIFSSARLIN